MASKVPPVRASSWVSSNEPPERQIQVILDHHFETVPYGVPVGCNVVIMQEGRQAYGLTGGKIPRNAPQHWGSISKQFTAACIDKLVEAGYLKYDDDIRILCPDLPEFEIDGVAQKITVDDLLHMRSGLPDVWNLALMKGQDPESLNNDELLALLSKHSGMMNLPGTKEMYCNTNYFLLAKIVEQVAKRQHMLKEDQTFADFVRDQVFIPHGMSSRCSIDATCPKTIDGFSSEYNPCTTPCHAFGATGIVGPPDDMVRWNEALARGELNALLEPPHGAIPGKRVYCRGLNTENIGDYRRIRHSGLLSGFVTVFRRYEHRDPKKTFAFFLATNYEDTHKADEIADKVADILAGEKLTAPKEDKEPELPLVSDQITAARTLDAAEALCGIYRCDDFDTDWVVTKQEVTQGIWGVNMLPSDHSDRRSLSTPLPFMPRHDEENIIFQFEAGRIKQTEDGFLFIGKTMTPVHFTRQS